MFADGKVPEVAQRGCRTPETWKIHRLVFLEKPNAKFERSLWIALLSVFSEWFSTVLVELPHEKKEPIKWRVIMESTANTRRPC